MTTASDNTTYAAGLLAELARLPYETEWIEFKVNQADPEDIGEYISALSNSAALLGKRSAYIAWGIEDGTHALVGTTFDPRSAKVGNEELENWLLKLLSPKLSFRFLETSTDGKSFVLLEIEAAFRHPVTFQGRDYIRIGSYKKNLKGRTIIEKFEAHAAVDYAVVVMTPDDMGGGKGGRSQPRARQNVVLEHGFFIGILGRNKVAALVVGDIEKPSDLSGVLYITWDDAGAWRTRLAREMQAVSTDSGTSFWADSRSPSPRTRDLHAGGQLISRGGQPSGTTPFPAVASASR